MSASSDTSQHGKSSLRPTSRDSGGEEGSPAAAADIPVPMGGEEEQADAARPAVKAPYGPPCGLQGWRPECSA
eukprot:8399364-Alexandrium_andersonii.AAC.1